MTGRDATRNYRRRQRRILVLLERRHPHIYEALKQETDMPDPGTKADQP